MKKLIKILVSVAISFIFFQMVGCSERINQTVIYKNKAFNINCSLENIEYWTYRNKTSTIIFGSLDIVNYTSDTNTVDLNKVKIKLNNITEGRLYINSIASVMLGTEIIAPGETKHKSIYWRFDNKINKSSMESFSLIYN